MSDPAVTVATLPDSARPAARAAVRPGRRQIGLFVGIVLTLWTLLHVYAAARLASVVPPGSLPVLLAALALGWIAYPLARVLERTRAARIGRPLELVGGLWLGALFLIVFACLAADVVTGFGLAGPAATLWVRRVALLAAGALSLVAVVLGGRAPRVVESEVTLPGLPRERDGTVVVQLTDLHLGSLLGARWLARIVGQVKTLAPDLIALTGDIVDGRPADLGALVPELRGLQAPLGLWAVTGNHEFYAGVEASVRLLEAGDCRVLRDACVEVAPGLVLAGVDDLTARRQLGLGEGALDRALAGRARGVAGDALPATVLLSHSPLGVAEAAGRGVGLMLCGHTHGGQIWPFGALVRLVYPYVAGRYRIGGMTLIVSRGTGTWGPRMRLWRSAEIHRITLRTRG